MKIIFTVRRDVSAALKRRFAAVSFDSASVDFVPVLNWRVITQRTNTFVCTFLCACGGRVKSRKKPIGGAFLLAEQWVSDSLDR